jgi:hypothetical protein
MIIGRSGEAVVQACTRGTVKGAEIVASPIRIKAGQLILSASMRGMALSGSCRRLDGAVVTNDFPLFDVNQCLDTQFLAWLSDTQIRRALSAGE